MRRGWLWLLVLVLLATALSLGAGTAGAEGPPTAGPPAEGPPAEGPSTGGAPAAGPTAGPTAGSGEAPPLPQHGPPGVACAHCHEDPHPGGAGAGCQDCHGTASWSPPLFTVEQHASTAFPLLGRHQRVGCHLCHVDHKLTGLPQACNECHLDRHRGKLGSDCEECHDNDGFRPVKISFDHTARTGFALTGPHGGVECASCHQGDNGRAMRLVQTATCATCHTSAHGEMGEDCVSCHSLERETFAGARFDHRQTGFALTRRHSALECSQCHPVGSEAVDNDERCQSCHVDPHAGQLGTVCGDCHEADRWRLVRFDHDVTLFPLRGRHFVAPCASCHPNQRWVGLRTQCWDCHAFDLRRAPATVPAHLQGLSDCGDCHTPWAF